VLEYGDEYIVGYGSTMADQFALVHTGFIGTLQITINIRKSSSMP
jgi:hypothetical protein